MLWWLCYCLSIYVLTGCKVTTDRGWCKKSGEGSSKGGSTRKRKRGKTMGKNSQLESNSESLEDLPPGPGNA